MTFFARYGGMQADEREAGHVMIEDHAFVPYLFVVATGALFAFLAFVHVVVLVAGKTGITTLFLVQVATMAILAGNIFMRAL